MNYQPPPYPNRLRVIRQSAGYTQRHVARLLGHGNSNALCAWESERTMPSGSNLIKLCVLYGKTPRELYPDCYRGIQRNFTDMGND